MSTVRDRLTAAFDDLRSQGITPVLVLAGTTGVRQNNLADYLEAAERAGTPDRWVGAHVGATDTGGAFWDQDGDLRYAHTSMPVTVLLFSFPHHHPTTPAALLDALRGQGFATTWTDDTGDCVALDLFAEALR